MRIADRDSTGLRNTARDVTPPRDRACVHSSVIPSVRSIARAVVVGSSRGARGAPPRRVALSAKSPIIHSRASRAVSRAPARVPRACASIDSLSRVVPSPSLDVSRTFPLRLLRRANARRDGRRSSRARCGHRRSHASVARARTRSAASASRSSSSRAFVRSSRVDVRRLSGSIGGGAVRRRRRRVTSVILCDTVVFRILYVSCVRV